MPKDILLYGSIWEYNAIFFNQQIEEALEDDPEAELTLRVNCAGGNPEYAMSIILKAQELKDQMKPIVEGQAHSMAFALLAYLENVSSIDTAQFLLHRASYGSYTEERPEFEGSIAAQSLVETNKALEKALRAKMDVEKFEALPQCKEKGITLKKIFSLDDRLEVLLSAQDMKKIGLVDKIVKVTPQKAAQIDKIFTAASHSNSIDGLRKAAEIKEEVEPKNDPPKNKVMTREEIQNQHPTIYAAIRKEAFDEGVANERDRAGAWAAWMEVDKEAALKGIKEGKMLTATDTAEFQVKAAGKIQLEKVKKDAQGNVITEQVETAETEKAKKEAEFLKEVDKAFGKTKKQ